MSVSLLDLKMLSNFTLVMLSKSQRKSELKSGNKAKSRENSRILKGDFYGMFLTTQGLKIGSCFLMIVSCKIKRVQTKLKLLIMLMFLSTQKCNPIKSG